MLRLSDELAGLPELSERFFTPLTVPAGPLGAAFCACHATSLTQHVTSI